MIFRLATLELCQAILRVVMGCVGRFYTTLDEGHEEMTCWRPIYEF